ncbi:MAG: response regulator [Planctomycetaceae bacterium]
MTTQTILVIDDSATIRKMVDSHLSQEGYRVVLAPNGETGIRLARELQPDLILLDHQLPGMLGIDVCRQIIEFPECCHTPFVVSSTLRKQAYVEYMDVANVVDSLPKPFKPELLKTTVANALEVGAMIVASQTDGTAVPETVGDNGQPAMSGDFRWVGLRELLDFLNNGQKSGMLEVESERHRIWFFLHDGRIQGVVSASFNPQDVADQLPESMKELAPLLKFTMSCGASSQVDGIVELLDRKVLDPRMLRVLLRHQAAVLTRYCFRNPIGSFSFVPDRAAPSLIARSSLDTCLAALLVEGALHCDESELPADGRGWVRHVLRGQNLDRSGLSARHVQMLSQLDTTPVSTQQLASSAGLPIDEVRRVFEGFRLAEWVQPQAMSESRVLLAFETEPTGANMLRSIVADSGNTWTGNVVKDEFVLQLMLKRKQPSVILLSVDGDDELNIPEKLRSPEALAGVDSVILILPEHGDDRPLADGLKSYPQIRRPYSRADILRAIDGNAAEAVSPAETMLEELEQELAVSR